jgi:hypothetical protein
MSDVAGHLAIVLPGGNNDVWTAPVLLPTLALEQVDAIIERVSYAGPRPQGLGLGDSREFNAAVGQQVAQLLEHHDPARVSFVAKSRGTLFLATLDPAAGPADVEAIWVTPLLGLDYVRAGMVTKAWPSLVVAGSADPHHDPAAHGELCDAIGARSLVIEGANHGLVVEGDAMATVEAYRALAQASLAFAHRQG